MNKSVLKCRVKIDYSLVLRTEKREKKRNLIERNRSPNGFYNHITGGGAGFFKTRVNLMSTRSNYPVKSLFGRPIDLRSGCTFETTSWTPYYS